MTEERKDAIGLLAEKVMKFPGLKDVTREFLFSTWNPFVRPADAVRLMEALPKGLGFMVHLHPDTHRWRAWPYNFDGPGFTEESPSFAETLATAIHRLVVERPELFVEGK